MKLAEKLIKVYEAVEYIPKNGRNNSQNYDYVRSADVTHSIRTQLTLLNIYAEINFFFEGTPYTIARSKEPNAPFSAVNVRCTIVFHDMETNEILTSSGLGSGCDTSDKAAYKAQTGALKYALKNAFLVPDEADPEADESVDQNIAAINDREDLPSFQEPRHAAPRQTAAKGEQTLGPKLPGGAIVADTKPAIVSSTTSQKAAPSLTDDGTLPTEEELTVYRKQFSKLGDDLSTEGKLKASKNLPINRKLLVFLIHITGATEPKTITKAQWDNFFARVDAAKSLETGLIGLAKLVNTTNGL